MTLNMNSYTSVQGGNSQAFNMRDFVSTVGSRFRMAGERSRESRNSAKQIRDAADKRIEDMKSRGISSILIGVLGLIFATQPFLNIQSRALGMSPTILDGYDLASGSSSTAHTSISFGAQFAILWLIVAGSALAVLFGFIALLPSMSSKTAMSKSSVRNAPKVMGIAGIMMLVGAIVGIMQFLTVTSVGIYSSSDFTFSMGWGPIGELGLGILLTVTAIKV